MSNTQHNVKTKSIVLTQTDKIKSVCIHQGIVDGNSIFDINRALHDKEFCNELHTRYS